MSIGVVSVGMGNIASVSNAVYQQGWDPLLVSHPDQFDGLSHLILPGVGAYASAIKRLSDFDLIDAITKFQESGRPILGICLGMQLLSEFGVEGGRTPGLGFISGDVRPLGTQGGTLRIPHVGWNVVTHIQGHPVTEGIKSNLDFYFVNSFFFNVQEPENIISHTEYGQNFPSIAGSGNVVGVQFHPEKSQGNGLKMIDNFCLWDGKC